MDLSCGSVSVSVGGMGMLTCWCVLGSSLLPWFLMHTQEPVLLVLKLAFQSHPRLLGLQPEM